MSFGRGLYFNVLDAENVKVCDHDWEEEEWNPNWEYCIHCDDSRKKGETTPFGL